MPIPSSVIEGNATPPVFLLCLQRLRNSWSPNFVFTPTFQKQLFWGCKHCFLPVISTGTAPPQRVLSWKVAGDEFLCLLKSTGQGIPAFTIHLFFSNLPKHYKGRSLYSASAGKVRAWAPLGSTSRVTLTTKPHVCPSLSLSQDIRPPVGQSLLGTHRGCLGCALRKVLLTPL